jgi:hypothetical protein
VIVDPASIPQRAVDAFEGARVDGNLKYRTRLAAFLTALMDDYIVQVPTRLPDGRRTGESHDAWCSDVLDAVLERAHD